MIPLTLRDALHSIRGARYTVTLPKTPETLRTFLICATVYTCILQGMSSSVALGERAINAEACAAELREGLEKVKMDAKYDKEAAEQVIGLTAETLERGELTLEGLDRGVVYCVIFALTCGNC